MVFEILVAILSVCGVILLLWCVTGCFLRPFGGKALKVFVTWESSIMALVPPL